MNVTVLAIVCLLAQVSVAGAVYFFLISTARWPGLIRVIAILLFAGLESALLRHIIVGQAGRNVETGDVLTDVALAASIAVAFGFGLYLLNFLGRSPRRLAHSESLSSTLFDQSSEPVIIFDQSGHILDVNRASSEHVGFTKDELLNLNLRDLIHPDESRGVMDRLITLVPGEIARTSSPIRRKDGSWMHADASTRRLDDGTFLSVARDVTHQTRQQRLLEQFAEASSGTGGQFFSSVALSLSETLDLEHVLVAELLPGRTDRARTLALVLDRKLVPNIEYDLPGTPCDTVVGKTIVCYPSGLQELFPEASLLAGIGATSYVGTPLFASDGSPLGIVCALSRELIVNETHCRTVLACYSHRVESEIERMQVETALRESEERYSNVVNVSPFGMHMYRLEEDGRLILEATNPAADWLLGIDHSNLIGKTIEEAFPSLTKTEVPDQYRRVAAHGERWRSESITYRDSRIHGAYEVVAFQRSPMKMAAVFMNITDRKQSEEALRESEAGLASAQRITHIGNWTVDPVTNLSSWSAEMYRMCGMNPKDKSPTFFEYLETFVHPDDRDTVRAAMTGLLKGRVHQPFDYRIILPDGSVRICQVQSAVEFDPAGRPVRISGTTQDITDRKMVEDKLRSSEERYRNFIANASEGIFSIEFTQPIYIDAPIDVLTDRITEHAVVGEVNEALAAMYKLHPEDMAGQPVRIFAPDCGTQMADLLQTPDCRITEREETELAADGSEISIVESYFGIVEDGQLVRVWGVQRDVTDRKRVKEDLKTISDRLALATSAAGVGIWDYDLATGKLLWDGSMYRLYGITAESFAGAYEAWKSCVHPDDLTRADAEVQQALLGEKDFDTEFRIVRPDGSVRNIRAIGQVYRDHSGHPVRMLGTNWDITDLKRTEQELLASEKRMTSVFDAAGNTLFLITRVDGSYRFESVNHAFERVTGLPKHQVEGKFVDEVIPEPSLSLVLGNYTRAVNERTTVRWEEISTYPTGTLTGIVTIAPILNERGECTQLVGSVTDITERKKWEEELRDSEQKFAAAFQTSPVAMAISTSSDGTYVDVNEAFRRIIGFSREEVVGKTSMGLGIWVTPEDRDCATRLLAEKGSFENLECRVRAKDGTILTGLLSASLIVVRGERRYLTVFHDITDRKQAEEMLCRQNEFLVALEESALDLVSEHDLDTLLKSIVRRAGQLIGASAGFIDLLEPGSDHLTPKISLGFLDSDSLKYALRKGEGLTGKVWELGRPIVIDDYDAWPGRIPGCETNTVGAMLAAPLVVRSGLVGVIGLAHEPGSKATFGAEAVDRLTEFARFAALAIESARLHVDARRELTEREREISARKQTEAELQRSLSLVRATLESTADGILVVDRQGSVVGYNRKFLEHWRIPITLANQKDDARLIAYVLDQLTDPEGFVRKVTDLYANPLAESFDLLLFKDGRYFERYSVPQRIGDDIIGRVWCFRNVTERKRAEIERSKLEERLRLSQKLETIGTLAAGIAHDFNNLLVPVIGYTELADSDLDSEDPKHEHLAEVLKAAYRAKSLVGQILAFSRQQTGVSKLVRLESIIEESARLLKSTLDPGIALKTTFEPDLPPLFADTTQLHQVIMNLCVNASHAMKNGGILTMSVATTSHDAANCRVCGCQMFGRHLELCVADTGHGMDQATLRRIFDPFFTTKPVGEGTGLGLAVSHGIIAHHGGHICASSEVGKGTRFYIYLPAVKSSDQGPELDKADNMLEATRIPHTR